MPEPSTIVIVAAIFLVAGAVKGAVGFGLPAVSIALLAATLGFRSAIALVLIPAFAANVWQGLFGGHLREVLARLWPYLAAGALALIVTASAALAVDATLLSLCLGLVLVGYAGMTLAGLAPPPPGPRLARVLTPAVGAVNGVVSGLTGVFVVPSGAYFASLGLARDLFVQALGLWFLICSFLLLAILGLGRAMPPELVGLSLFALVPAFAGMALGQLIRRRLDEARFRLIVLVVLVAIGLNLVVRALVG